MAIPRNSSSTSTDHEWTRREYSQSLTGLISNRITVLATRGWTPGDLRHELGGRVEPLLFLALPRIATTAPGRIAELWMRDTPPCHLGDPEIGALEKMLRDLQHLGSLDEWEILSTGDPLEEEARFLAGLSPQQRKAHHRIHALLKKAESTSFEKEAETLIDKAEQLRQQYRIEAVISDLYSPGMRPGLVATRVRIGAPWIRHQFRLLSTVARAHSCAPLLLTGSGISTVIGTSEDVAHVIDLFTSLNRQRDHFMRRAPGAQAARENNETSSYRHSFMIAYASNIGSLLRRAADEVVDSLGDVAPEAPGSVVAAFEDRRRRAESTLHEFFPDTTSFRLRAYHTSGYRDGRDAAARSRIGGDSAGLAGRRPMDPGTQNGPMSA
ncbi:DUF2786 domain-containing protein [Corynebacterium pacaense]|uniref:DUF2786 domain-containing protein n=1 Tax=Corynebacterium pacaense TaxID=1816684 RepID=UPI0009BB37C5|nr:DUF2786 domain-containing protein [Corynebacterium pacaense]